MTRILFSSVCRPFGGPGEGDSVGAELFNAQVTRAQGIFSLRQVIRCWAIDYLAENIQTPCVTLHYPSEREFIRELRRERYDYIGLNFVVATFHKLRRMVELIRRHSPGSRIILGGYGTVLPDDLLLPFGDYICREEGVGFMRRLLGEPLDRPIRHPYAPIPTVRMYSYQQKGTVAHLTAGLGCPNGCDFCCTSHFFKRAYVPFLQSGREVYDAIREMTARSKAAGDQLTGFILIDEDFFLQKRRAREFLECVRAEGPTLPIMGFGSVRGLSQFTPDEIAEMNFDTIWTAFEGTESGYGKLQGKSLEELYSGLKSRGINILSSMIIGFPYQNREKIMKEYDRLLKLAPSLYQVLIYFAFPGTPFHKQVLAEKRYLPEYADNPDLRRWDGFSMHFKHPEMTPEEVEKIQKELFRKDYELLGPSIVRLVKVWFDGYENLRNSENPVLRQRALRMRQSTLDALPGIAPATVFGPTQETRAAARTLFQRIRRDQGGLSPILWAMSAGSCAMAVMSWVFLKLRLFQQPALFRVEHRIPDSRTAAVSPHRMQGGFQANPLSAFIEDVTRNTKDLLYWVTHGATPKNADGYPTGVITRVETEIRSLNVPLPVNANSVIPAISPPVTHQPSVLQ